jgi:hypothetical protein
MFAKILRAVVAAGVLSIASHAFAQSLQSFPAATAEGLSFPNPQQMHHDYLPAPRSRGCIRNHNPQKVELSQGDCVQPLI